MRLGYRDFTCTSLAPRSVYFCAIPSSSPVQNELSLTTPNFLLFVLELPFPNRKAEVIFHYSFWNFRSQIEEKADLPQFVLGEIEKPRTFRFGTCPPNRREDAKAEIVFTIRYETWSWSRKDQRHFSINHFPIRIETRSKTSAFKLDTGCHEGLYTFR